MSRGSAAVAFSLFALLAMPAPARTVVTVVGQVQLVRAERTAPATAGMLLEQGDELVSGESAEAMVRFDDGGRLALRPDSRVVFKQLPDASRARFSQKLVKVARGQMRYVSGHKRSRHAMFETLTATIGIRGTDIEIAISEVPVDTDPPGTFLKVRKGLAFIRATDGTEADVAAGQVAFGGEPELVARGSGGQRRPAARPASARARELFKPGQLDRVLK